MRKTKSVEQEGSQLHSGLGVLHEFMRLVYVAFALLPREPSTWSEWHREHGTAHIPRFHPFDVHIWFADCEGIDVFLNIQVGESVVHEPSVMDFRRCLHRSRGRSTHLCVDSSERTAYITSSSFALGLKRQ